MKKFLTAGASPLRHLSMAALLLVSTVVGVSAHAQAEAADSTEATIKKLIEPRLGKDAKVDAVTKTPYSGLYEIQIDGDVIYTDAKTQYLFIGRVVDAQNYRDYTKEKIDSLNQVPFSGLPLDKAIKTVKGNGKRVIAIFEDPNCIYCKRLHKTHAGSGQHHLLHLPIQHPLAGFHREVAQHLVRAQSEQGLERVDGQRQGSSCRGVLLQCAA